VKPPPELLVTTENWVDKNLVIKISQQLNIDVLIANK